MGADAERQEQLSGDAVGPQSQPQHNEVSVQNKREGLGLGILNAGVDRSEDVASDYGQDEHQELAPSGHISTDPNIDNARRQSVPKGVATSSDLKAQPMDLHASATVGQSANISRISNLISQSKNMSEDSLKAARTPNEKPVSGFSDSPEIDAEAPEPVVSWPRRIVNFVRAQWFLITMAILIIIASQKQVPERHQKKKNDIVAYAATSVIFFLTGVTLKTKVLLSQYARWKIHLWVQVQSFLIVSLLMFALVSIAATNKDFMDPGLLCGMVLTGTVATTISSNVVMTGQAHGNTALTVTQSTLGNVIGIFLTPALFKAYTSTGAWYTKVLPNEPGGSTALYRRVFRQLGLSVFIPLVAGQIVHNITPENLIKLICTTWKVGKLGSVALLVVIWSTYDSAFSSGALHSVPGNNIAFVILMSIVMFFVFLAISYVFSKIWLDRPDTVACCYCIPAKSPAIGIPLSTVLFTGLPPILQAKLQLPLVLYQGLQILAGTVLTGPFAAWVDRDDALNRGRRRHRNPV